MSVAMECRNINYSHPGKQVLSDFNCRIESAEAVAILGPSGCGKTSLLRLLAGLARPDSGEILLRGEVIADGQTFVPPEKRSVGFVFQNFALFEKVSVERNIYYGCKTQSDKEEARRLIDLMNLQNHLQKKPYQLSGGEKQKVALARTLALRPDILLMDEPFSSIDPGQTQFLIKEIKLLFKELKITSLMVTHSPQVSEKFSDRIINMPTT